ncbi:hypothetical protein ACFL6M_07440 [Candidatus Eisenbacteria bacterium]|uniref:Penicillin-binding protein activator LpoB n=1 Tax=Eiseniibacteriota bacterium TaxID=2212470 RepID=A0ABV6YM71_UNCEI
MERPVKLGSAGILLLVTAQLLMGCAAQNMTFVHPGVDFGHIRRCAILPFMNQSSDDLADERMRSIFLTEILDDGTLEIVGTGETLAAIRSLQLMTDVTLTPEEIQRLGSALSVDAFFFGVIEEYGLSRTDRASGYEVTAVFGMTETQTGTVVWRTQVHVNGSSMWTKLFGGGTLSLFDVSRKAVRKGLETLF